MTVVGQDAALGRLRRMLRSERLPPALLFWGPDGVGKRTAARALAAALVCRGARPEGAGLGACGSCPGCVRVERRSHPDVAEADWEFQAALLEEPPEKQQNLRIETVRELTRRAALRSGEGGWKVFIVDNAHRLVPEAANALLKALEEPAPRTLWILVTARRGRLLPTVRSRCQHVPFRPLGEEALKSVLAASGLPEAAAAAQRSALAGGSVTAALRLARHSERLEEARRSPAAYWAAAQTLPKESAAAREAVDGVLDCLLAEARGRWEQGRSPGLRERAERLLALKTALRRNAGPSLVLQLALLESEP